MHSVYHNRDFSRFSEDRPTPHVVDFWSVTSLLSLTDRVAGRWARWSMSHPFRTFIRGGEVSEGPIERLGPSFRACGRAPPAWSLDTVWHFVTGTDFDDPEIDDLGQNQLIIGLYSAIKALL